MQPSTSLGVAAVCRWFLLLFVFIVLCCLVSVCFRGVLSLCFLLSLQASRQDLRFLVDVHLGAAVRF